MRQSLSQPKEPRIIRIEQVLRETPSVRSFLFDDEPSSKALAGTFLMIWVPGSGEVPMSLSMSRSGYSSITLRPKGEITTRLFGFAEGEKIGVHGPYGNGFKLTSGSVLLVGGGTGIVPIMRLCDQLIKYRAKVTLIIGARTKDELLFLSEAKGLVASNTNKLDVMTDDGSYGNRGLITDAVDEALRANSFDMVYTCGPELMMRRIFRMAENERVSVQASLERPMACGIGLCGSCYIDGLALCVDGPVLSSEQLRMVWSKKAPSS